MMPHSYSIQSPQHFSDTPDLERVVCDYCGNDDTEHLATLPALTELSFPMHRLGATTIDAADHPIDFVRCRACGLVYMNPRLTEPAITRFYDLVYSASGASSDFESDQQARTAYLLNITEQYLADPQHVTMLDIGCGAGQFLYGAQQQGWSIHGSELSSVAAQTASERLGVSIHAGDYREMTLPPLDFVSLLEVMEHLRAPIDFVRDAVQLLKPGGVLLIEVPNIDALEYRVARWTGQMYRGFIIEHLYYYSPAFLQRLMDDLEMDVLRTTSRHATRHYPNPLHDVMTMLQPATVDAPDEADHSTARSIPALPPVSLPHRILRQLNNYMLDMVSELSQGPLENDKPVGNTLYMWAKKR